MLIVGLSNHVTANVVSLHKSFSEEPHVAITPKAFVLIITLEFWPLGSNLINPHLLGKCGDEHNLKIPTCGAYRWNWGRAGTYELGRRETSEDTCT